MQLPKLDAMWAVYPGGEAEAVKRMIGGGVAGAWITNTCVIRVSHCFNLCGSPIPRSFPGLMTTYGKDGSRYAFRVSEFKPYLERQYKRPEIRATNRSQLTNKKGVIMFDVRQWSDATGHFDLWNGQECAGHEYFAEATQMFLWLCE